MKTLMMFAVAVSPLVPALPAHAAGRARGIVPLPNVRKQILQTARQEQAYQALIRPSLRVEINGKTATASVFAPEARWPGDKGARVEQMRAVFKLVASGDGIWAEPLVQAGVVWQPVVHPMIGIGK